MAHPARSIQIHLCLALLSLGAEAVGDSARGEAAAQEGRRRAKGGGSGASSSRATILAATTSIGDDLGRHDLRHPTSWSPPLPLLLLGL
uniref:Uncharacterized protein n=1 Tax=Oryza glumipatula TaxID=40148 RepID=A0A0E0BI97_9ORYZ